MSNFYDDSKFGVINRKWFSLPITRGGDAAAGITFNESEATKVKGWHPKGPIHVSKFGVLTVATLGKGEQLFALGIDGVTTRMAAVVCSTTSAPGTIASTAVDDDLSAGSYLALLASTNVCSTGTVACFVDFNAKYQISKWDV